MKLTTGILAVGLMTGGLWAQNPNVINNGTQQAVQTKTAPSAAQAAKPAPGGAAKPVALAPAAAPAKAAPARSDPFAKAVVKRATKPARNPHPVVAAKDTAPKPAGKAVAAAKIAGDAKAADTGKIAEAPKAAKPEEKKWAMSGKRDPFFSPVVQQPTGSGCSTGKKCLEIGQINLRGVVKSETGFIAVVTNSLNKAYFLRENDPVFNGYVMRITGDTVVFQETVQDKLGKPLTREVVKRIFTPAV